MVPWVVNVNHLCTCSIITWLNLCFLLIFLICFVYSQVKDHIGRLVQNGVESGARLVLDGRDIVVFICFFPIVLLE